MVFEKILVPYDNSPNSKLALKKALTLAALTKSNITIVHVIAYHKAMAKIVEPYTETIFIHVKKFLDDAKKEAHKKNIKTEEKILYGNPSEEILGLMKKKKFDLVIMGKRGTTKLTGPSLGSVSNALVQTSKVPVLIIS
ncbi:Universal stress protein YxiE [Marine Group I thaumarchaeote SCGC AAA799-E16]|uniref:Universal stress protein YxiE n=3 Tax=Marine Group I TaxID=905826 RepID=A0A087S9B0_9ARCH|nr:Universal stress protein YxiE [Marine Group I thaumarchaeote SCGC AAA799-E16]KFM18425.1 Universal stress protein YxiE [Marine Group I thaumarchaeote SCGC RSA3]KFM22314.1 Universal stress protein YxiE [Marine Group I thaumarchaeote SCGC AAA799-B03]